MYQTVITDRGHKYTCESPDKARVISFIEWMLDGLTGNVEVTVNYRQSEPPINQVKQP